VKALTLIYTASSEQAAKNRSEELATERDGRYRAVVKLWEFA